MIQQPHDLVKALPLAQWAVAAQPAALRWNAAPSFPLRK